MTKMLLGAVVDNGRIVADFMTRAVHYNPTESGCIEFATDLKRELQRCGADTVNLKCGNSVNNATDLGVYIDVGEWLRAAIRLARDLNVPEVDLSVPEAFTADDIRFLLRFVPSGLTSVVPRGINPMFYVTGSYQGDVELRERIVVIRRKLGAYEAN